MTVMLAHNFVIIKLQLILQLLSVSPSSNALSLVYRDEESLRFTKYINHRAVLADSSINLGTSYDSAGNGSSFYSIVMLYKEV